MEVGKRSANTTYSRVFCFEWAGKHIESENPVLVNHREIGEWSRDNSFFRAMKDRCTGRPGCILRD